MESLEQFAEHLRGLSSNNPGLTIVITGASSGIGLEAAKVLALMNPIHRLVLVCRNAEKARATKEAVASVFSKEQSDRYRCNIIPLVADHCSLENVRDFNVELRRQLDESYHPSKWAFNGIDVLCLNAAVLHAPDSRPRYTVDGLEETFQTNHLAPFLLANLLADLMNPGSRMILSTSGLHTSQKLNFSGILDATTGKARKGFAMIDGTVFHYKKSYSLAKLCNVAVCRDLHDMLFPSRGVMVTCFSPGLMMQSGLFRHQPKSAREIIAVHNAEAVRRQKTVRWGAGALVFMAISDRVGQDGGALFWRDAESFAANNAVYGEEFCPAPITEDTVPVEQRALLWEISCKLSDLPCDYLQDPARDSPAHLDQ